MKAFSDHPFHLRGCQECQRNFCAPRHKTVECKTERELVIVFHLPSKRYAGNGLGTRPEAAEQLAVSRPVVSKVIADLEHALGVRLLERDRPGAEGKISSG